MEFKLAIVGQLNWSSSVAVTLDEGFDAIAFDAALAGMDVGVAPRPEVFRVSIPVVPPAKCDVV